MRCCWRPLQLTGVERHGALVCLGTAPRDRRVSESTRPVSKLRELSDAKIDAEQRHEDLELDLCNTPSEVITSTLKAHARPVLARVVQLNNRRRAAAVRGNETHRHAAELDELVVAVAQDGVPLALAVAALQRYVRRRVVLAHFDRSNAQLERLGRRRRNESNIHIAHGELGVGGELLDGLRQHLNALINRLAVRFVHGLVLH